MAPASTSSASSKHGGGGAGADAATATALLKALNAAACGTGGGPSPAPSSSSFLVLHAAADDVARAGAGSSGAASLPRVLAYSAASSLAMESSTRSTTAWSSLLEAAEADLSPGSGSPWDVKAAALGALLSLPDDLAVEALGGGGGGGSSPSSSLGALGRAPAVLSGELDDGDDEGEEEEGDAFALHHRGAPRPSTAARCLAARVCGSLLSRPALLSVETAPQQRRGPRAAEAAAAALGDALLDEDRAVASAAAAALGDALSLIKDGDDLEGEDEELGEDNQRLAKREQPAISARKAARPVVAALLAGASAVLLSSSSPGSSRRGGASRLPASGGVAACRCVLAAAAFARGDAAAAAADALDDAAMNSPSSSSSQNPASRDYDGGDERLPPPQPWVLAAVAEAATSILDASAVPASGGGSGASGCVGAALVLAEVAAAASQVPPPPPSLSASSSSPAAAAALAAHAAASAAGAAPTTAAAAGARASAAIGELWDKPGVADVVGVRPALAKALCKCLLSKNSSSSSPLSPAERARIARQLLSAAADLSAATDRCGALASAWAALVDVDLGARAARRAIAAAASSAALSGSAASACAPSPSAALAAATAAGAAAAASAVVAGAGELRAALASPEIAAAIRGDDLYYNVAAVASPATYREELVCSLLGVVSRHPAATTAARSADRALARSAKRQAKFFSSRNKKTSPFSFVVAPGVGENGASGSPEDDWLSTARVALQGTRACLGWDLQGPEAPSDLPPPSSPPTTAPIDAWLSVLGDALCVARALEPPDGEGGGGGSGVEGGNNNATPRGENNPTTTTKHREHLQSLLKAVLVHWQAVPARARPRALQAAVASFDLPSEPDGRWALFLRAAEEQLLSSIGGGEGSSSPSASAPSGSSGSAATKARRRGVARAASGSGKLCVGGIGAAAASSGHAGRRGGAGGAIGAAAAAAAAAAGGGLFSNNPFFKGSTGAGGVASSSPSPSFVAPPPPPPEPASAAATRAEALAAGLAAVEAAARRVASDVAGPLVSSKKIGGGAGLADLAASIAAVAGVVAVASGGGGGSASAPSTALAAPGATAATAGLVDLFSSASSSSVVGPDAKERASRVVSSLGAARAAAVRAEEEARKEREEARAKAAAENDDGASTTDSDLDDLPDEQGGSKKANGAVLPFLPPLPARACGDGVRFAVGGGGSGGSGHDATTILSSAASPTASAVAPPPGAALALSPLGRRHAAHLATVSRAVEGAVGGARGRKGISSSCPAGVPGPAEVASAVAALTSNDSPSSSSRFSLVLPATDLAGTGDPIRLLVTRAELRPPPWRDAAFDLSVTNVASGAIDLVGAAVRLELSGAAVAAAPPAADGSPSSSNALLQRIPRLAPGSSFSWRAHLPLALTGPGAATLRARLLLRLPPSALAVAAASGNAEEPGCLRLAGKLSWGPADWVKARTSALVSPPPPPPLPSTAALSTSAADFFAAWSSTPSSPDLCWRGVSARVGPAAGPAVLGALTRGSGIAVDWLVPLPACSGFAAALRGCCASGLWSPSSAAAVAGGASTSLAPPPPALIFVTARLGVVEGSDSAALLPRSDVRCELRTSDAALAAAVAADAGAFFVSLASSASSGSGESGESELLRCASVAHGGGAPPRPAAGRSSAVAAALAEAFEETVSFEDLGGGGAEEDRGGATSNNARRRQAAAVAAAHEFWRRSLVARAS